MKSLLRLITDDEGATAVEYAVMLGLILITAIAGISTFGQGGNGLWSNILGQWNQFIGP